MRIPSSSRLSSRCVTTPGRHRRDEPGPGNERPPYPRARTAQRLRHRRRPREDDSARHGAHRPDALRRDRLLHPRCPRRRLRHRRVVALARHPLYRSDRAPFARSGGGAQAAGDRPRTTDRHRARARIQDRPAGAAGGEAGRHHPAVDRARLDRPLVEGTPSVLPGRPLAALPVSAGDRGLGGDPPGAHPGRRETRAGDHGAQLDRPRQVPP